MKLIRAPGLTGAPVYLNPEGVLFVCTLAINGQEDLTKALVQYQGVGVYVSAPVERVGLALMEQRDIPIHPPSPALTLKPNVVVPE